MPQAGVTCPHRWQLVSCLLAFSGLEHWEWCHARVMLGAPVFSLTLSQPHLLRVLMERARLRLRPPPLPMGSAHLSGSCSMHQETQGGPAIPAPGPKARGERGHRVSSPSPPAQDSLLRLEDHRQCFECSDVALNEAVQQMVNATETAAKEEWVATVTQLLQGMEQALSADGSILRDLSSAGGLTRLTNNLIQVTWPLLSPPAPSQRLQPGELPAVTPHLAGHRLQHGCAGGAQGAPRDLGAALGHPVPGHPAGGGRLPVPVPPAAAPAPGGRRCGGAGPASCVCIQL